MQESDAERVPLGLSAFTKAHKIVSPTNTGRGHTTRQPKNHRVPSLRKENPPLPKMHTRNIKTENKHPQNPGGKRLPKYEPY